MIFFWNIAHSSEFVKDSENSTHAAEWKLVGVADNDQRGSSDRVKQKIETIKRFAREAAAKEDISQPMSSDDREGVQSLRLALQTLKKEAMVSSVKIF